MASEAVRGRGRSLKKLLVSLGMVAAGAALATQGAFSLFTSAATGGPQSVTSGTVVIALGATGAATNRLNVNAANVAPGDTIQRAVDLSNTGSLSLASITLGVSASPSSLLDNAAGASEGLTIQVQSCSSAWTEAGPPYTYTCSTSPTTVLAATPVSTLETTAASLPGLKSLATGSSTPDYLVVTLALPSAAGNTYQGLSSTLTYTFTGTQRAAQAD